MAPFSDKVDLSDIDLVVRSLRWPSEFAFPCLDLTRLVVLNAAVVSMMTSVEEAASGL